MLAKNQVHSDGYLNMQKSYSMQCVVTLKVILICESYIIIKATIL